jgi:excinuclease UvrABC nuclease subunit
LIQSHTDDDVVRFEAYDIAHLSGKQMVGVMTVVENATAQKNDYRKFIIRGFDKANDAGALREVLVRTACTYRVEVPDCDSGRWKRDTSKQRA